MKFYWPLKGVGVKQGVYITQYFGEHAPTAPPYGGNGLHNGLDIRCDEAPIYASHKGHAKFIVETTGFGMHVKIYGNGFMTVYAHMSKFEGGERDVEEGELIGFSGNTGYSTGPHLHFGFRLDGANQNDGFFGYSDPLPNMKIHAYQLKDKKEITLAIPLDTMDRWQQMKKQLPALEDYQLEDDIILPFKKPW